jgi:hypothetical protein
MFHKYIIEYVSFSFVPINVSIQVCDVFESGIDTHDHKMVVSIKIALSDERTNKKSEKKSMILLCKLICFVVTIKVRRLPNQI